MVNKNRLLYLLSAICLIIPVVVIFKNILGLSINTAGDAPHYWPEEIGELLHEPLSWTERGAALGDTNMILWISPLLVLMGSLNKIFGLQSGLLVSAVFYLPSILFSLVGPYLLTRYLKLSNLTSFFASLVYTFNTYFILLIDGGQVGVALSYGMFPFAVLFLKKFSEQKNILSFICAITTLFLCGVADPRIAIITFLVVGVWVLIDTILIRSLLKITDLLYLFGLLVMWLLLNLYWIIPLLRNSYGVPTMVPNFSSTTILHSLLLYSPHWPSNIFGKVSSPSLFFGIVPLTIFIGFLFNMKNKLSGILILLFITFAFLAKGTTEPLSWIYVSIIKLPFGQAFRDSTKFFAPTILFAGILYGNSISLISDRFLKIRIFIIGAAYLLILAVLYPAILGHMNLVLSRSKPGIDSEKAIELIRNDQGFFRTAWLPEKQPVAPDSFRKPAIDSRDLVNFYPLANLNAGEDPFNYINNQNFYKWFQVLGIKYLLLSGDPRVKEADKEGQKNWNALLTLVSSNEDLEKLNSAGDFPAYKIDGLLPKLFAVKKLYAVVGPFLNVDSYNLNPAVYFEDGKLNPRLLEGKDPDSVALIFNGGADEKDLAMSFLQKYFTSAGNAVENQWAVYTTDEYLKYKYQLLIRGINYNEMDYSRGVAFSSVKNERIVFNFDVEKGKRYVIAKRMWKMDENRFVWEISEPKTSENNKLREVLLNNDDISILNVIALTPEEEFKSAERLADVFVKHFGKTDVSQIKKDGWFEWKEIESENLGTLKYKLNTSLGFNWIILTDNYHPLWQLKRVNEYFESLPVYSSLNAFYVEDNWNNISVEFLGQNNFRWGVYFSLLSFLILTIVIIWKKSVSK